MPLPGDWICGSCQYLNYFWRRTCRRCNEPVIGQNRILKFGSNPRNFNFRPGDWFCDVGLCRAHNFARRRICYKCGALKSMLSFGGSIGYYNSVFPPMTSGFQCQRVGRLGHHHRGWRVGDWFCGRAGCNAHNYGARVLCFRCNSSRELLSIVS